MASLPARQQPQRRPTPEQSTNDQSQTSAQETPVRARSAHSEDSQTLFLNSPKDESQQQQAPGQDSAQGAQGGSGGDGDVKKCWICFADSTEDTPETSPWRDPCPCALVAHEECLLDWIADMEAPNRSRARSLHAPKIECPQCKSEIKLSRPRNLVVEAVRGMERATTQLVTPGAVTLLMGTLYNESMLFGVHSIYAVFGSTDGVRILRPLLWNIVRTPVEFNGASTRQIAHRVLRVFLDHMVHWRLYVGVPLIGPILVLSRTTLADTVLPVLPVLFFATQMHSPEEVLDFGAWPPSASLSFAILPYLRQAYNSAYKRLFADKEKQWLREIQPRVGQNQNEDAGNGEGAGQAPAEDRDDGNMFEVRIDGGIWEEWEEEEDVAQDQPPAQNAPQQPPQGQDEQPQAPAQQDGQADPPPNIADDRANNAPQQENADQANPPQPQQAEANAAPAAPANNNANANGERRLSFSPTAIAHSVLGALIFPSIAGMSGELLKLALPRAWTTAPAVSRGGMRVPARGLLQEKWGRSLVGGCLFVLVKDAVMLYVKWKMAQMHRERRVVDFEGKRRRDASA